MDDIDKSIIDGTIELRDKLNNIIHLKVCCHCKKEKNVNDFYKNKSCPDGIHKECKDCHNNRVDKYVKTKKGLIYNIYYHQHKRCKLKCIPLPSYTKHELYRWIIKQDLFHELYNQWTESDYEKNLIPSIDRKNDFKGYSFDNIQLMTWLENKKKYDNDRKNGINNKNNVAVLQYDLDGNFIKEYYSINQAVRETGLSNIWAVCNKLRKQNCGYVWRYKYENNEKFR